MVNLMINSISFTTNIEEILSVQELADIFNSITSINATNPTFFPLLQRLEVIKGKSLERATMQRNFELSKLKSAIIARKMQIQLEILRNKNELKKLREPSQNKEVNQGIYELEQITNVLEDTINSLVQKDAKVEKCMKNQEKEVPKHTINHKSNLKEQYEELLSAINYISKKHDGFLKSLEGEFKNLLALINDASNEITSYNSNKLPLQNIVIDITNDTPTIFNNKNMNIKREYYLYEPDLNNLDDKLIYMLLEQNDYNGVIGKINDLEIFNDEGE